MTKWKETCFFILRQLYTAKSQKCWPWSTLRSVGLWTPMLAAGHTNTSAEKCHSRYLTQTSKAVIPLLSSQRARKSHFPNRPIPSLQGNLLGKPRQSCRCSVWQLEQCGREPPGIPTSWRRGRTAGCRQPLPARYSWNCLSLPDLRQCFQKALTRRAQINWVNWGISIMTNQLPKKKKKSVWVYV